MRLLLLLILLFTACAPKEAITIRWAVAGDPGAMAAIRRLADRFERENPRILVQLQPLAQQTDYQRRYYHAMFSAGATDIDVLGADIIWTAEFASKGWILPLDDRFTDREDFVPTALGTAQWRGKTWAVPMLTGLGMLYYRKDLLAAYGYEPPATWDELKAQVQKIKGDRPELHGYLWQGTAYEGLVCNALEFTHSAGGTVLDQGGVVALNSPATKRAWATMASLIPATSPDQVRCAWEETGRLAFLRGEAIFHRNWPYVWQFAQAPDCSVRGKVGMAPLPSFEGGASAPTLGGWNLMIAKRSRHPDAAWKLVSFLTSAAVQKELAIADVRLPTRTALYQDAEILAAHPVMGEIYPQLLTAKHRPTSPEYPELSLILQQELSSMLEGDKGPDQAVESAEKRLRQL